MKGLTNEIKQLQQIKEQEGLSYDELARRLGVNPRNVYRWLKEGVEPRQMATKIIKEFLERQKND